jgi:hypothetical protein
MRLLAATAEQKQRKTCVAGSGNRVYVFNLTDAEHQHINPVETTASLLPFQREA